QGARFTAAFAGGPVENPAQFGRIAENRRVEAAAGYHIGGLARRGDAGRVLAIVLEGRVTDDVALLELRILQRIAGDGGIDQFRHVLVRTKDFFTLEDESPGRVDFHQGAHDQARLG